MVFDFKTFKKHFIYLFLIVSLLVSVLLLEGLFELRGLNPIDSVDISEATRVAINQLVISEVMASNDEQHMNAFGEFSDWVELYNGSDVDISLRNFGLTDRVDTVKWLFPDVVIPAKGHLVVYLIGENREGLYANFRISANRNERIILKTSNGSVVDAVEVAQVERNHALIRQTNGQWLSTADITPGFENTLAGRDLYLASLVDTQPALQITQFLPSNRGTTGFVQNRLFGFVVITNVSDSVQSLAGATLSNSLERRYRAFLPPYLLQPNASVLIWMKGSTRFVEEPAVDFTLDNVSGSIVLSNAQGLLQDYVEYDNLVNGFGMVRQQGMWRTSATLSGPFAFNAQGIRAFNTQYRSNPNDLIINEVMNRNTVYLPQQGGQTFDWIELKNNSNAPIDLSHYALSTSTDSPLRFVLPSRILQPNEMIVVFASGEEGLTTRNYIHLPFRISDVQMVTLFNVNGSGVDSVFIADLPVNMSLARDERAGFYLSTSPSPLEVNGNLVEAVASAPQFETQPGVFNDVESVLVRINAPGEIFYTLDGNVPTRSSRRYVDGITLDKTSVIRAISFQDGLLNSEITTGSFIINENHVFPVVSMTIDQTALRNLMNNLWVVGIEHAGHLELYEETGSFSVPVGIRLFGGSARGIAKKSFSIKFKTMYGQSQLHYPLFDNRDFNVFDNIVLRSGSQDFPYAFFRDELATSLADGLLDVSVQAYKPAIVYINGAYYGIMNIREKVDDDFISRHFNVDSNSSLIRIDNVLSHGDPRTYYALLDFVANNDVADPRNFAYVAQRLDLRSYADFWVAQQFLTNNDIVNTRFFRHPDINGNRWRMVLFDLDWAMYNYGIDFYRFTTSEEPMSALQVSTLLFRNVMRAPEFRTLFLERLAFQYRYVYNSERVLQEIDRLEALYAQEMPRDRERWGLTMSDWHTNVDMLRNYWRLRPAVLRSTTQRFFNLTNAQMLEIFGS